MRRWGAGDVEGSDTPQDAAVSQRMPVATRLSKPIGHEHPGQTMDPGWQQRVHVGHHTPLWWGG